MATTFETVRELSQEAALLVGVVGGCITAFRAVKEMRSATKQRHEELRWKRAQAAKMLIDDIHKDDRASAAVTMLDWHAGEHAYPGDGSREIMISYADVLKAVSCEAGECRSTKDVYIRDCMDWFLYYLDRIEHYITTEYIDFIDVKSVFRPYSKRLIDNFSEFGVLINERGYLQVAPFLQRYQANPKTAELRVLPHA